MGKNSHMLIIGILICFLIFSLFIISFAFKYSILIFKKELNESRFSAVEIGKILNKVRNTEPLIYTSQIDKNKLESAGINLNQPVYVERADLLKMSDVKNLWLARQIYNFNLIFFYNVEQNIQKFKSVFKNDAKFFNISDLAKSLKENLLKLNINHNEKNSLNLKPENKITPKSVFQKSNFFKNFCLEKNFVNKDSNLNIKQTFFKGQYFFINPTFNNEKSLQINFSKALYIEKFDYLILNKEKNSYLIKGIINNFKYFLYSPEKIKNVSLIKVKNSKSYNLKCEFELKPQTQKQKSFWFHIGRNPVDKTLNLNSDEIKKLNTEQVFSQILNKIEKQFNLKISSLNSILNYYFNKFLPKSIILEGIKNDEQKTENKFLAENLNLKNIAEYEYFLKTVTFKQLIQMHKSKRLPALIAYKFMSDKLLLQKNDFLYINKTELKNYELKLFFENKLKSIFVKSGIEKKMIIGNISYYNCRNISLKTLKDYDSFEIIV